MRVIELGSGLSIHFLDSELAGVRGLVSLFLSFQGTGLVGILCAKLGASVVLTDKCFALPLMQANARENAADSVRRSQMPLCALTCHRWLGVT